MPAEFVFARTLNPPHRDWMRCTAEFDDLVARYAFRPLPEGITVEQLLAHADGTPAIAAAVLLSLHAQVMAQIQAGRPIELEWIIGAIKSTVHYCKDIAIVEQETLETRLIAFVVQSYEWIVRHSADLRVRGLAAVAADHVRIVNAANAGNVVYRDPHLLVSWISVHGTKKPELYVCTRCGITGMWVYLPQLLMGGHNLVPPISSFRAARHAIANWRGRPLTGELVGSSAIRLCNLLGIEVQGDKGIIHGNRRCAQGFAK